MPHTRPPYSPEFRRQMVDLVRAGRDPADLAREFEPSAQAIRNWVAQSDRREGRREEKSDVLPAAERDELVRLRRENKQLRLERDISLEPRPGSPARQARCRPGLRIHERESGRVPDCDHGARARRVGDWLPCMAPSPAIDPCARRRGAAEAGENRTRRLTRDIWGAPCARRAAGRRRETRAQADCAAHARRRSRRRQPPPQWANHNAAGQGGPTSTRSGRPPVLRPGPEPAVDGSLTSPSSRPPQGSSISRSCSMSGAAKSSAGRWRTISGPSWCSMLLKWRSVSGDRAT